MLFILTLVSLLLSSVAAETLIATAQSALDTFIQKDSHWNTEITGISTTNGSFLVFYRGSSLSLGYHFQADSSIDHRAWLDGVPVNRPMNITNISASTSNGTTFISGSEMDHQLRIDVSSDSAITLDSLNITYASTNPLSTLYGNRATQVPRDAGILDDQDSRILRSNGWQNRTADSFAWNNTLSTTSTPGSWIAMAMVGKGASFWIYGMMETTTSFIKVEVYSYHRSDPINVTEIVRVGGDDSGNALGTSLYQVPLYKLDGFTIDTYYLVKLTLLEGTFSLDYIRSGTNFQTFTSLQTYEDLPESVTPETVIILVSVLVPLFSIFAAIGLFLIWRRRYRRQNHPSIGKKSANFVGRSVKRRYTIHPYETTGPGTRMNAGTKMSRIHNTSSGVERQTGTPTAETRSTRSTESPVGVGTTLLLSNTLSSLTDRPLVSSADDGEGAEDEDQPIAMTHEELALVFARATELRTLQDRVAEYGYDEDRQRLEERKEQENLETLARQLAGLE